MGDIILDAAKEKLKDEQYKMIAINALKAMTDMLVLMSGSGVDDKDMMRLCVWPILEESEKRFNKIANGEEVKLDGFEHLVIGDLK
jgi:hypothetical protein